MAGTVACLKVTDGGNSAPCSVAGLHESNKGPIVDIFSLQLTMYTSYCARYFMWIPKAFGHISTILYFSYLTYETV